MTSSALDLARRYYAGVVAPLLLRRWPGLPHAAARLGSGSDVLGLDDHTSRDHDWGLRLTLLIRAEQVAPVDAYLEEMLPDGFEGFPTRFATTWSPTIHHQVEVATAREFARSRLGVDASEPLALEDWLSLAGQSVLEVTAGPVFVDSLGELTAIRRRLDWYPEDLWRHLLATDWRRIGRELPFVGRAGQRGDDLGSRVIAARLARSIMHLGFLLERRWPPYSKWFGTVFAELPSVGRSALLLEEAMAAPGWPERERGLGDALGHLLEFQRSLGLPVAGGQAVEPFFERPFLGVPAIPEALLDSISDPAVRALPASAGSLDQFFEDVDLLVPSQRRSVTHRLCW